MFLIAVKNLLLSAGVSPDFLTKSTTKACAALTSVLAKRAPSRTPFSSARCRPLAARRSDLRSSTPFNSIFSSVALKASRRLASGLSAVKRSARASSNTSRFFTKELTRLSKVLVGLSNALRASIVSSVSSIRWSKFFTSSSIFLMRPLATFLRAAASPVSLVFCCWTNCF